MKVYLPTGPVELDDGATVADLLERVAPDAEPRDFAVEVGRRPVGGDHRLRSGDRVTVRPLRTRSNSD